MSTSGSGRVEIAGRKLRVRTEGEGAAVLLLHALPTSGELWRDVILRLAGRSRVIAPLLPKLRIPVEVVWGEQDPFQKPKWAERLAADIPTAELTRIKDVSHFAPADAPGEVADALERLLDRLAGP